MARALQVLAEGEPAEAAALIKARDTVGAFADFVHGLRQAKHGGSSRFLDHDVI